MIKLYNGYNYDYNYDICEGIAITFPLQRFEQNCIDLILEFGTGLEQIGSWFMRFILSGAIGILVWCRHRSCQTLGQESCSNVSILWLLCSLWLLSEVSNVFTTHVTNPQVRLHMSQATCRLCSIQFLFFCHLVQNIVKVLTVNRMSYHVSVIPQMSYPCVFSSRFQECCAGYCSGGLEWACSSLRCQTAGDVTSNVHVVKSSNRQTENIVSTEFSHVYHNFPWQITTDWLWETVCRQTMDLDKVLRKILSNAAKQDDTACISVHASVYIRVVITLFYCMIMIL